MNDADFKKLIEKAKKEHQGKGYLERFLEDIARRPTLIFMTDAEVRITAIQ